jgi:hypothetical protein
MSSGSNSSPGFSPRHPGHEAGIHPLGALRLGKAVDGAAARLHRQRRVHHVGGVQRLDAAFGDAGLGVALLAPGFDGKPLGGEDRRRTRHLAGGEASVLRTVHLVPSIGGRRRLIGDQRLSEQEDRAGSDDHLHPCRVGKLGVGR